MWVVRGAFLVGLVVVACSACSSGDRAPPEKHAPSSPPAPPPADAAAPIDDRFDSSSLGSLAFALSEGSPAARAHFTRGLLALHSFWYDEALREFQAAIDADPQMNMAYWGVGMSHCKLLWGDDNLDAARAVVSKMPNPDRLSPREQAWVMAGVELLRSADVRSSRTRFAGAMEQLHATFPDDESATFLALAHLSTIRPDDPDPTAVRTRAAALAKPVFDRNPKHPGAAHYLIHAYDTPEFAERALPYARQYAAIAPAAFHARHMPAHIFSRLGMWSDAIASCRAAWDASLSAAKRSKLSPNHHDFHSLNWLIEMPFELGQRGEADRALATFAAAVRAGLNRQHRALYATQVASYMARSGDWARVDELLAPLDAAAADDDPPPGTAARADAPSHCAPGAAATPAHHVEELSIASARAHAAAMRKDAAGLAKQLAAIDAARAKLRAFLASIQPKEALDKADAAHARRRQALLARSRGDDRALVAVLRKSVADFSPDAGAESNPTGFVIHEELGEALMRLRQPKQAAAEYGMALQQHPKRARSLLGAARAAAALNDVAGARSRYQELLAQWSAADEGTDGLAEARGAVTAAP